MQKVDSVKLIKLIWMKRFSLILFGTFFAIASYLAQSIIQFSSSNLFLAETTFEAAPDHLFLPEDHFENINETLFFNLFSSLLSEKEVFSSKNEHIDEANIHNLQKFEELEQKTRYLKLGNKVVLSAFITNKGEWESFIDSLLKNSTKIVKDKALLEFNSLQEKNKKKFSLKIKMLLDKIEHLKSNKNKNPYLFEIKKNLILAERLKILNFVSNTPAYLRGSKFLKEEINFMSSESYYSDEMKNVEEEINQLKMQNKKLINKKNNVFSKKVTQNADFYPAKAYKTIYKLRDFQRNKLAIALISFMLGVFVYLIYLLFNIRSGKTTSF